MAAFEKKIPHELSVEEAVRRTHEMVSVAQREFANFVSDVSVEWRGNVCYFTYLIEISGALKKLEDANPLLPKVEVPGLGKRVLARDIRVAGTVTIYPKCVHIKTENITIGGAAGKFLDGLVINLSLLFVNIGLDRVAAIYAKKS